MGVADDGPLQNPRIAEGRKQGGDQGGVPPIGPQIPPRSPLQRLRGGQRRRLRPIQASLGGVRGADR